MKLKIGVIVAIGLIIALGVNALGSGGSVANTGTQQTDGSVPTLINYQGYLTDASGNPLTGNYQITFSIYGVPSGGTPLWSENQTVKVSNDCSVRCWDRQTR